MISKISPLMGFGFARGVANDRLEMGYPKRERGRDINKLANRIFTVVYLSYGDK